jgi:hypothetical protein
MRLESRGFNVDFGARATIADKLRLHSNISSIMRHEEAGDTPG